MFLFFVALGATAAVSVQRSETEDISSVLEPLEDDFRLLQTVLSDPERWLRRKSLSFLETDPVKTVEKLVAAVKDAKLATAVKDAPKKAESAVKDAPKKTETAIKDAPKKAATDEESVKDMILKVKNVPVSQMPLLLGFMKDMYDRFKHNIARANKLEEKSKATYKKNLAEKAKWSESFLKDKAMMNLAKHWDKARELSHRHYHNMLKLSHAGMARLKVAIDMMEQAIAGKKLSKEQMTTLKEMAPEVVFLQLQGIVTFCGKALRELQGHTLE